MLAIHIRVEPWTAKWWRRVGRICFKINQLPSSTKHFAVNRAEALVVLQSKGRVRILDADHLTGYVPVAWNLTGCVPVAWNHNVGGIESLKTKGSRRSLSHSKIFAFLSKIAKLPKTSLK